MPFTIERNDLATVDADAIVVAANERLQITGGVGASVARVAGLEEMQAACDAIGHCPCGSAVATPGFSLKAKMVVHAVGPVWVDGRHDESGILRETYDAALECAVRGGARSVALPLISAGTYGFPAEVSLAVARESIRAFLNRHDDVDVRLVLFSRESVRAGMAAYLDIAVYIDDHYVDGGEDRPSTMLRNVPDGDAFATSPTAPAPASAYAPAPEKGRVKKRRSLRERFGKPAKPAEEGRAPEREEYADAFDALPMAAAPPGMASAPAMAAAPMPAASAHPVLSDDLEDLLNSLDAPFSTTLLALVDQRGMTDVQVYKRANMSRQLFSKIRSDKAYRPTKKTVLALAVALELDLTETRDLLARAGFALSSSSKADVIVEYFIAHGNHDIFEINEALYAFDQPLL